MGSEMVGMEKKRGLFSAFGLVVLRVCRVGELGSWGGMDNFTGEVVYPPVRVCSNTRIFLDYNVRSLLLQRLDLENWRY